VKMKLKQTLKRIVIYPYMPEMLYFYMTLYVHECVYLYANAHMPMHIIIYTEYSFIIMFVYTEIHSVHPCVHVYMPAWMYKHAFFMLKSSYVK